MSSLPRRIDKKTLRTSTCTIAARPHSNPRGRSPLARLSRARRARTKDRSLSQNGYGGRVGSRKCPLQAWVLRCLATPPAHCLAEPTRCPASTSPHGCNFLLPTMAWQGIAAMSLQPLNNLCPLRSLCARAPQRSVPRRRVSRVASRCITTEPCKQTIKII